MPISKETKKQICSQLQQMLSDKAEIATSAIKSAKEARNNDTKSSAGDKYETGRAMMQIEIEKNEVQLNKIVNQQKELSSIDFTKIYSKSVYGSLIETNHGVYFISIGIGKIAINNSDYYVVSLVSPIGQALKDRQVKERFQFQGREYIILDIV